MPTLQGFDEFMNLVVDDAVEVYMSRGDQPEKTRPLGKPSCVPTISTRSFPQARSYSRATMSLSFRACKI